MVDLIMKFDKNIENSGNTQYNRRRMYIKYKFLKLFYFPQ